MLMRGCMSCGVVMDAAHMRDIIDSTGRAGIRCVACLSAVHKRNKQLGVECRSAKADHPRWARCNQSHAEQVAADTITSVMRGRGNHYVRVTGLPNTSYASDVERGPYSRSAAGQVCREARVMRMVEIIVPDTVMVSIPAPFAARVAAASRREWVIVAWTLAEWIATTARLGKPNAA